MSTTTQLHGLAFVTRELNLPACGCLATITYNTICSCYMNSILQMLFSVPELANRYGTKPKGDLAAHPLLLRVPPKDAPTELLVQTTKVACALTSGVFAKPILPEDDDKAATTTAEEDNNKDSAITTDPKYRLAPRMFKQLIGKDHVEFRTGQQQDACQFLQYMLEQLDRSELKASNDPYFKDKNPETFHVASHLFSFKTTDRLVCNGDGAVKYKESSGAETVWSLPIPMDKAVVMEETTGAPELKRMKTDEEAKGDEPPKPVPTVPFLALLDQWAAETIVEGIRWPHLQNEVHKAAQKTRLSNFPPYLILQIQRYQLGPDWQPMKLEVKLDIPQTIDLNHLRSKGPQDGETLVPEVEDGVVSQPRATPEISEGALCQLMDMGFSMNGCKRALTAVGGSDVEAAMNWVFEVCELH
jgi:ubiquitin carboxyl-terminal hydrolase 5/13